MQTQQVTPTFSTKYVLGAILTDSWGYDQTNIDFYCIIKISGHWITVLPMTKKTADYTDFMTCENEPGEIIWNERPVRRKLKFYNNEARGFSFRNYKGGGWCNLWNGKPIVSTHYA